MREYETHRLAASGADWEYWTGRAAGGFCARFGAGGGTVGRSSSSGSEKSSVMVGISFR